MDKTYTINEILLAMDEIQKFEKSKDVLLQKDDNKIIKKEFDIPADTLRLIEDAEESIKSTLILE